MKGGTRALVALLGLITLLQLFHSYLTFTPHTATAAGAHPTDLRRPKAPPRRDKQPVEREVAPAATLRRDKQPVERKAAAVVQPAAKAPPPRDAPPVSDARGTKPHVVYLLADDLGWHGVGWRNPEVITPNLDRLATKEGIRLSQHYTYRTCSPSRCALLSGRLAHHVNQANPNHRHPGGGVDLGMTLLPQALKAHGYATHMLGKWHLGLGTSDMLPTKRGFDTFLGFFAGAEDHWNHRRTELRKSLVDLWLDEGGGGGPARDLARKDAYGDELFTRRFEALVAKHPVNTPLFVYFAYQVAHDPLQAPRAFLSKYPAFRDVTMDGDWKYLERNSQGLEYPEKRRAQYHSMVSYLDHSVHRVERSLKARRMWESSLIVFATDNGGATGFDADAGNNWPLRGAKYSDFDGGVRGVCFVTGGLVPKQRLGLDLHHRRYRVSIADWYATFLDLAGGPVEDARAFGQRLPPLDSQSLWPTIAEGVDGPRKEELPLTVPARDAMPGSGGGLLMGRHKLLIGNQKSAVLNGPIYPNGTTPRPLVHYCKLGCLFDLDEDPGEVRDVASTRGDVLAVMLARFAELQKSAYATPRYAIWQDEETMARHVSVVEREHGGFWGPYTSLAVDERAPVVELPFQPWDRLHRPELVEAQRVALKKRSVVL